MLLANGMSGARTAAKRVMATTTAGTHVRTGSRRAAKAQIQVFQRKMRSPCRVASAYAVQRNGATVAVPGRMPFRSPISADVKPICRHQGVR
jgi:hypothetical protein